MRTWEVWINLGKGLESRIIVKAMDKADAIVKACEQITTLTPTDITGVGIW